MTPFIEQKLPYIALCVFLAGAVWRVARWLSSPVPLPLTLFPVPRSTRGKLGAIAAELFLGKSLFRENKSLWLWAGLLHLSLALVVAGHLLGIYFLRGQFVLIGLSLPASQALSHISARAAGIVLSLSLCGLLVRRLHHREARALSGPRSYFDLLLILAIALTGVAMSLPQMEIDLGAVRSYLAGLLTFHPIPAPRSALFAVHLLLVNILLLYFPFSRLMHAAGFFVVRAMLVESPPTYPTPRASAPRSAFATRSANIPSSAKAPAALQEVGSR